MPPDTKYPEIMVIGHHYTKNSSTFLPTYFDTQRKLEKYAYHFNGHNLFPSYFMLLCTNKKESQSPICMI